MFKTHKKDQKPIQTANPEWPNRDESWAEFMVRKDCEDASVPSKIAFILGVLIVGSFVLSMIFDALDKAAG